ncbi:MAG: metallophosphoesterase family protein [Pseudomonadota bacterium]
MKDILRLFRRPGTPEKNEAKPESAPQEEPPRPERLTYAVGDIHGCLAPLEALLQRIRDDAGGKPHDIVFLGDYVDRGPESARVLERLRALEEEADERRRVICLKGNHDAMMLHFMDAPEDGVRWLFLGGQETLASFGIGHVSMQADIDNPMTARVAAQAEALRTQLGDAAAQWLAARPLWWRSGDLVAVHALTDPALPMEAQSEETLLWERPGRRLVPRADGTWIVHGHTIVPEPSVRARHVSVDTGAFNGGPLTAAVFTPGSPIRFVAALRQ